MIKKNFYANDVMILTIPKSTHPPTNVGLDVKLTADSRPIIPILNEPGLLL